MTVRLPAHRRQPEPVPDLGALGALRARLAGCRARLAGWRAALEREVAALTAPVVRDPRDTRFLLTLVVVSLVVFAAAARLRLLHGSPSGDEPAYLVISQTLQKYHSFNVLLDYRHSDYRTFYPAPLEPHVVPGPDGRLLPLHSPGGPLLWLVPFVLWGRAGAVGFMVVLSALLVANVYRFLRERQIQAGYAVLTALVLAIGSPIYVYAAMSFVEPIGALIVLYAVRVLLAHRPHPVRVLVASLGLAYAPWVHPRLLIFSVTLGALLVGRLWLDRGRPRRAVLACCLGPLLAGALAVEWYAFAVWHSADPVAGMTAAHNGPFQTPLHSGLAGTLFDRQFGLIPSFPIFLLVLPGILLTRRRPEWLLQLLLFVLVAPYTVLTCTFWGWFGGYSPPARFISVLLPLLSYYIAVTLQRLRSWWLGLGAVGLGLFAYILALAADIRPNYRFQNLGSPNAAMDQLGRLFGHPFAGHVPSSFHPGQAGRFWEWTLLTFGVGIVLYLCGRTWYPPRRDSTGRRVPAPVRSQRRVPERVDAEEHEPSAV